MIKKCKTCSKEFKCYKKGSGIRGRKRDDVRPSNSINCSRECSKIYRRINEKN